MSLAAALVLLARVPLAPSPLDAADATALDRATAAVFAPYRKGDDARAAWERDIWSSEIAHLITHWQAVVPEGEVDDLNDGDWLCQCQDWDAKKFGIRIVSKKATEPGIAEVEVDIDIGFGERRDAFLVFRKEAGDWRLDDLYSEPLPDGIKDALHRTIAADEALAKR